MHREELPSHESYRMELVELTADLLDAQLRWVQRLRDQVEPECGSKASMDG